ncbi:hypothetical protein AVEN_151139-1, partial [Araneus ventricosus]
AMPDTLEALRLASNASEPEYGTGRISTAWGAKRPHVGVVQKYPHWPDLPKKGVRPVEDQRGESRSTSMWRTGFIGYNKMIQALPEQGQ